MESGCLQSWRCSEFIAQLSPILLPITGRRVGSPCGTVRQRSVINISKGYLRCVKSIQISLTFNA